MITVKVLTWNVSGANFLKLKNNAERIEFKRELNGQLQSIVDSERPDFIALQQIVKYGDPSNPEDLVNAPQGYHLKFSTALDNQGRKHPNKWGRICEAGGWSTGDYLAIGYGLLWIQSVPHCSIWNRCDPKYTSDIFVEEVYLNTGLYTGNRDTEPRLAVVSHFVIREEQNLLDLFLINLHLTTLKGEPEGLPDRALLGCKTRLNQVDTIMHGIISRHNEWRHETGRDEIDNATIWVLAGDFNCVPQSPEVEKIEGMGFLDLNPNKGIGTRANVPGEAATVTLDYIFAGLQGASSTPSIIAKDATNNAEPVYRVTIANHFPLIAKLAISV